MIMIYNGSPTLKDIERAVSGLNIVKKNRNVGPTTTFLASNYKSHPIMEALKKHIPFCIDSEGVFSEKPIGERIHPEYYDRIHEAGMLSQIVDYNHTVWMLDRFMVPVNEIPRREDIASMREQSIRNMKQLVEIWDKRKKK